MGFNTSVIVMNDALGSIEHDQSFGEKLSNAIRQFSGEAVDIASGPNVNAASVIETHHSSVTNLLAFGGNYASFLHSTYGYRHHDLESQHQLLQSWAKELGYKLN